MEDYHRQVNTLKQRCYRFLFIFTLLNYDGKDIAGGCIFLATKTEECGRKLRDVAKVAQSKITGTNIETITDSVCMIQETPKSFSPLTAFVYRKFSKSKRQYCKRKKRYLRLSVLISRLNTLMSYW